MALQAVGAAHTTGPHWERLVCVQERGPPGEKVWWGCTEKNVDLGFPGGAVVENLPANAGDTGLSPGLGRSHMPWSN